MPPTTTWSPSSPWNVKQVIDRYDGQPVNLTNLCQYQRMAFDFFHGPELADPHVEITVPLDITPLCEAYHKTFVLKNTSSLTAFLYWQMIQTLKKHPRFFCRDLGGEWFQFSNLPLVFPVHTGKKEQLNDVVMENVCQMDWQTFAHTYRQVTDEALQDTRPFLPAGEVWNFGILIINLPRLFFSNFHLHVLKQNWGRPAFCFGQRRTEGSRTVMPFFVQMDHANLDPMVLSEMVEDFVGSGVTR